MHSGVDILPFRVVKYLPRKRVVRAMRYVIKHHHNNVIWIHSS